MTRGNMKIKLSKSQREGIGKKAGWFPGRKEHIVDMAKGVVHVDGGLHLEFYLIGEPSILKKIFTDLYREKSFREAYDNYIKSKTT